MAHRANGNPIAIRKTMRDVGGTVRGIGLTATATKKKGPREGGLKSMEVYPYIGGVLYTPVVSVVHELFNLLRWIYPPSSKAMNMTVFAKVRLEFRPADFYLYFPVCDIHSLVSIDLERRERSRRAIATDRPAVDPVPVELTGTCKRFRPEPRRYGFAESQALGSA